MNETAANSWEQRRDWLIGLVLFVFLSSVYYATASGITSSNDGSHYALLRTMVENHSFALGQFDDYAEGNDIAVTEDGRLFSDRPPGTALLSTPFYVAAGGFPDIAAALPSRHDAQNPRLAYVLFLPAWAGAGAVVVLYFLMRALGVPAAAGVTAALMFGLGTAHWKYSSVLYSHALSAFLVITAVALALGLARRRWTGWATYFLLGLLLGLAVLTEYSNALLVFMLVGYVGWFIRPLTWSGTARSLGFLVLGGLLPALFLVFYNASNFGSPFRLSYAYAINYPWAGSFLTTFNYPLLEGLRGLLYWGTGDGWCDPTCFNQGLILLAPLLLLALPGWYFFFKRAPREALLTAVIFLVYLLLFARHRTYHGFTADGRYLVPYLGLLALPLGFFVAWVFELRGRPLAQSLLFLLLYGLFFLSLRNMALHIGTSYNYFLDLSQLDGLVVRPENWRYLSEELFPNAANLPLLWTVELVIFLVLSAGIWFVLRRKSKRGDLAG
jgi:hypothetical protein